MRILLIQTATDNPEGPVFPLGLAQLASVLTGSHNLRILDMNVEADPFAAIQAAGNAFDPQIVGLSFRNIKVARPGEHISCISELRSIVVRIRRMFPQAKILLGGAAFSLYADFFMRSIPEIDFGIVGEGELAVQEFLHRFPNPHGIKGIAYRQKDTVVFQGKAARPVFADLPWPRRDLFRMEEYSKYPTSVGVMTKRGCPYRCIHCSDIYLLGRSIRLRSPEDVIEELRSLRREYHVKQFMFADQTFNFPIDHTKELLRQLERADLGMRWTAYFTPQGVDREMVDLFKKSGCSMVSFSPDICNDEIMTRLRKGFLMHDLYRANTLVKEAGLPVTYNFMLGLPGENLRSLIQMLAFIFREKARLGGLFKLHGLFVVPVRIYPHTELHAIAIEEQVLGEENDLTEPTFYRHRSRMLRWLDKLFLSTISLLWKVKHRGTRRTAQPERPFRSR